MERETLCCASGGHCYRTSNHVLFKDITIGLNFLEHLLNDHITGRCALVRYPQVSM